jgi:hypothetical protein
LARDLLDLLTAHLSGLERDIRAIRRSHLEQERADRFWRLWDLRWGVRKEMLLVGLGVALPTFILGLSAPLFSTNYVYSVGAGLFMVWTLFGLVPPYFLRQEVTLHSSWVQQFMAKNSNFKDAKDFSKRLYKFLSKTLKGKEEKRGLASLVSMERMFEFMGRHAWWTFPAMMTFSLFLALLFLLGVKAFLRIHW